MGKRYSVALFAAILSVIITPLFVRCPPLSFFDSQATAQEAVSSQVNTLIHQLKDPDPMVRTCAAEDLGIIGTKARVAVLALIAALKDRNPEVRVNAAVALGNIGPLANVAVDALIETLRDVEPRVRNGAAYALGNGGSAAEASVPYLIKTLKEDDGFWVDAAYALGNIGPSAIDSLIKALKDKDPRLRSNAAFALGKIGPADDYSHLGGYSYFGPSLSIDEIHL